MKSYIDSIFSRDGSIAFSLELNQNPIQFTAHHFAPDRAFLYCKPAKAKTLVEIRKEQQLKLVDFAFRNAVIAVLFVSKDGSFYDCSDETYRLLGYTQQEFSRLTISDIDPKIVDDYWKKAWTRHKSLVSDIVYTKLKKKDGSLIDVEIKTKYFEHEGLEVVGAFITDITEKKRLEEASSKEKQLLRTLIDHLPFSIFVKDDKARKLLANITDIEYMGLTSEEESVGKTDLDLYKDLERNRGYQEDLEVLGKGNPIINYTGILISNDGTKRETSVTKVPLKDDAGNVYGLVGICKDITEEKKLVERLKLVDFAFRNSAVPMHFIKEDGSVYDCNNAACALLGYTQEEYLKKTIFDFNKKNSKELFKDFWNNFSNNSDKPTYLTLTNKDNELKHIEAWANKILYGNNELMCSSFIDITQKIKIDN
jgi:PAS domain S-box-containing protein